MFRFGDSRPRLIIAPLYAYDLQPGPDCQDNHFVVRAVHFRPDVLRADASAVADVAFENRREEYTVSSVLRDFVSIRRRGRHQ